MCGGEARLLRLSICFRNVYQHEIPGKRRQVEVGQNNWGISQLRLQRAAYFQPTKVYTTHMCSNLLETDMDTYGHGYIRTWVGATTVWLLFSPADKWTCTAGRQIARRDLIATVAGH